MESMVEKTETKIMESMVEKTEVKKEEIPGRSLVDLVFSWSLKDVLNEDLHKHQAKSLVENSRAEQGRDPKSVLVSARLLGVRKIPETFSSTTEYLTSFCDPLVEETHADLLSSMSTVSQAPTREIFSVTQSVKCKPPKDLLYHVTLESVKKIENHGVRYEPEVRDIIAITDVRPKCIDDLERQNRSYVVAFVLSVRYENSLTILSSKPILFEHDKNKKRQTLYAEKIEDKKSKKNVRNVTVKVSNENKYKKNEGQVVDKCDSHLSFEEFVQRRFNCTLQRLKYCNANLCTHLPTSFISLEVVKKMKLALDLLTSLEKLLSNVTVADKELEQVSEENDQRFGHLMKYSFVRGDCLRILRTIPKKFPVSFSNDFLNSMSRVKNAETCKQVLTLLENLANGWRQSRRKKNIFFYRGTSSQLLEQCLLVPMRWSVDSCSCSEVDPLVSLSKPLASLSLRDDSESSSTTDTNNSTMGRGVVKKWQRKLPNE
ncbi:hypothetical protein CFP56_038584 [Quercus suber]|uniref:Uncharacterized protein n=1 Tax=Quercus suber TaxID=58331 RepID=A0AAW0LPZ5_QUESU